MSFDPNIDWDEDRERRARTRFSLDPGRTVAENTKFIDYREIYLNQGYPFDVAEQRAWDDIWALRRADKELSI